MATKDLNTATRDDLAKIPQMSSARADTIVHYREQHGDFSSVEELAEIPGIGETMAAQVGEYFSVKGGSRGSRDDEGDNASARGEEEPDDDADDENLMEAVADDDEDDDDDDNKGDEGEDDKGEGDDKSEGGAKSKSKSKSESDDQGGNKSSKQSRRAGHHSSGAGGTNKKGQRLNQDGSVDKRQFNVPPTQGGPGNTADDDDSGQRSKGKG